MDRAIAEVFGLKSKGQGTVFRQFKNSMKRAEIAIRVQDEIDGGLGPDKAAEVVAAGPWGSKSYVRDCYKLFAGSIGDW